MTIKTVGKVQPSTSCKVQENGGELAALVGPRQLLIGELYGRFVMAAQWFRAAQALKAAKSDMLINLGRQS